MNIIILAAGQGTRLKPLTDSTPKCMVEVGGNPILQWQISAVKKAGLKDIAVVKGYMGERIAYKGIRYFTNEAFASTNMVETLWCAEPAFGDGFIVSYGDILYEPEILRRLVESDHPVSVVTDSDWNSYWSLRFDDILEDAETLVVDDAGQITEIGQKPEHVGQINGQYIGLTAFWGEGVEILRGLA